MNPQEIQALQDFLKQLADARGVQKDVQADQLISLAVAQQADAAYLLVQRAMLLDIALKNAKLRIADLESALQSALLKAPDANGSFLSPANSWGNSAQSSSPLSRASTAAPIASASSSATNVIAAPTSSGFFGGGMGGMLGTVAATAAGVAGGAFLYQGIEHLMHGQSRGTNGLNENGQSGLLNQQTPPSNMDGFADMQPSAQVLDSPASSIDLDSGFDSDGDMSS
jgi:hypothetical protein